MRLFKSIRFGCRNPSILLVIFRQGRNSRGPGIGRKRPVWGWFYSFASSIKFRLLSKFSHATHLFRPSFSLSFSAFNSLTSFSSFPTLPALFKLNNPMITYLLSDFSYVFVNGVGFKFRFIDSNAHAGLVWDIDRAVRIQDHFRSNYVI